MPTTHPSSSGEVQHCFPTELPLTSTPFLRRPKGGGTQASAKEAGDKPTLSATLPLRCLRTWESVYESVSNTFEAFTVMGIGCNMCPYKLDSLCQKKRTFNSVSPPPWRRGAKNSYS